MGDGVVSWSDGDVRVAAVWMKPEEGMGRLSFPIALKTWWTTTGIRREGKVQGGRNQGTKSEYGKGKGKGKGKEG